ncbi:hypothetical protein [Streptomyces marianii]|uniref:hypothetical protein n=1 Tax=Streptomyces marianii TaxID=1817406 RepID=UPI001486CBD7|nr:hypothetical protein [Streptomyces marianii]
MTRPDRRRSDYGTCTACGEPIEYMWRGAVLRPHLNPDWYLCRGGERLPKKAADPDD